VLGAFARTGRRRVALEPRDLRFRVLELGRQLPAFRLDIDQRRQRHDDLRLREHRRGDARAGHLGSRRQHMQRSRPCQGLEERLGSLQNRACPVCGNIRLDEARRIDAALGADVPDRPHDVHHDLDVALRLRVRLHHRPPGTARP
jgi:hypothetical protein